MTETSVINLFKNDLKFKNVEIKSYAMYFTRLVNIGMNTWKLDLIEKSTQKLAAYVCYEKEFQTKKLLGTVNYISPMCRNEMNKYLNEATDVNRKRK